MGFSVEENSKTYGDILMGKVGCKMGQSFRPPVKKLHLLLSLFHTRKRHADAAVSVVGGGREGAAAPRVAVVRVANAAADADRRSVRVCVHGGRAVFGGALQGIEGDELKRYKGCLLN